MMQRPRTRGGRISQRFETGVNDDDGLSERRGIGSGGRGIHCHDCDVAAVVTFTAKQAPASRRITEAGIYSGMPIGHYHGQCTDGPSVSSTGLRTLFAQSPAHFWHTWSFNPDHERRPETDAFTLGRAAHHLLLGEDDFATGFVVRPSRWKDWRTTEAQRWRRAQEREGRTVLTTDHLKVVRGMARGLVQNPLVRSGILSGLIEHSMIWQDEATGIWLKSRPDAVPTDGGDFADLKTTTSVQTQAIERALMDFDYAMQAALVKMGAQQVLGVTMQSFSLVLVEKTAPYAARVVTLAPEDIERGELQIRAALDLLAWCLKRGKWPAPGWADAEYVRVPPWAATRIENRIYEIEQEVTE